MISNIRKTFILTTVICLLLSGCASSDDKNLTALNNNDFTVETTYLSCGMLVVSNGKSGDDKRYGCINENGELAIPLKYKGLHIYTEDLARAIKPENETNRFCYIDKTGTEVITTVNGKDIAYGDIFIDGYAIVSLKGEEGSYVIDKNGKVCLAPTDEKYYYRKLGGGLFERYYTANCIDPQGVVDISGNVKYSGSLMLIMPTNRFNGFYEVDGDKYGILDNKNYEKVSEPVFLEITPFVDGVAIVASIDGKVQIIDPNGVCLVDLSKQYKNIDNTKLGEFTNGVTALDFTDDTGSVIIDINGNTVAKTDYNEIGSFSDGIAICKKDGKYGYVDSTGAEILKPVYEWATNIDNGISFVLNEGKLYRFTTVH